MQPKMEVSMTRDWVVSVGFASSKFLQCSQLVDLLTRLISWNKPGLGMLGPGSSPLLHGYFFLFLVGPDLDGKKHNTFDSAKNSYIDQNS